MTAREIDVAHTLKSQGTAPVDIHRKLQRGRAARGMGGPSLMAVRRALHGSTHKRSTVETSRAQGPVEQGQHEEVGRYT